MRSWQRVLLVGACILVAGAVATSTCARDPHGLLESAIAIVGIVGLGIGGSIVASALVARLVANQVFGIDIGDAVEALRGASSLTRANQSVEITLRRVDDEVHINAQHRFDLLSSSKFVRHLSFSLYTDVVRGNPSGGFYSIVEPGEAVLTDETLKKYLSREEGKVQFKKLYAFHPGKPSRFEVETFGYFRRDDRLIWTVEHISSDFTVRILDLRGEGKTSIEINHHRRSEIVDDMKERQTKEGRVIEFAYQGEVLPFQGFELQWHPE
jgi:hypothetical protein